jgi:hypothetical protein
VLGILGLAIAGKTTLLLRLRIGGVVGLTGVLSLIAALLTWLKVRQACKWHCTTKLKW